MPQAEVSKNLESLDVQDQHAWKPSESIRNAVLDAFPGFTLRAFFAERSRVHESLKKVR